MCPGCEGEQFEPLPICMEGMNIAQWHKPKAVTSELSSNPVVELWSKYTLSMPQVLIYKMEVISAFWIIVNFQSDLWKAPI